MSKEQPPKILWALFDAQGKFFDTYDTEQAAHEDAVGPRFHKGHTIRAYKRMTRAEEKATTA